MKDFHPIDLRERGVELSDFGVRSKIKNLGDPKLFQGNFPYQEMSIVMSFSNKSNESTFICDTRQRCRAKEISRSCDKARICG